MVYKIITTEVEVEVEVDLSEFTDKEIFDEAEYRIGKSIYVPSESILVTLEIIYQAKRSGKDYSEQLDNLIFEILGRI